MPQGVHDLALDCRRLSFRPRYRISYITIYHCGIPSRERDFHIAPAVEKELFALGLMTTNVIREQPVFETR